MAVSAAFVSKNVMTEFQSSAESNTNRALQNKLAEIFAENFSRRGELGASVSIWKEGREIASLAGGWRDRQKTREWTAQTPVLVWSATKGAASASVLHCLEKRKLSLETKVAEIWPEFGAAGKEKITLAELLSHRAGLPVAPREISALDHRAMADALARQAPLWPVFSRDKSGENSHGYHPRTFGYLLDEIVRRLCGGTTLGEYWQKNFAAPLGIDFWIGAPENRLDDIAPIQSPRISTGSGGAMPDTPFLRAFANGDSLTSKAFAPMKSLAGGAAAMNARELQMASFPAFGGIGTAHALGKFYAMLANGGEIDGTRFFSTEMLDAMSTTLSNGPDKVLVIDTAFSAGFMQDPLSGDGKKLRVIFGPSRRAFGHPGSGGSIAFADPENRIAFAYVMNQMEIDVLPNDKSLRLIRALYDSGLI